MKNEYKPFRPVRPTRVGDVITLGAHDGAAEPVQCAKTRDALDEVWQHAFSCGAIAAGRPDIWLLARGSTVRVLALSRSSGFRLPCAEIKVMRGPHPGKVGWIATAQRLNPLSIENVVERGEGLLLSNDMAAPNASFPTLVPTSLDALEELIRVAETRSESDLAKLVAQKRFHLANGGFAARVQDFGLLPNRALSCAKVEMASNAGAGLTGWILARETEGSR